MGLFSKKGVKTLRILIRFYVTLLDGSLHDLKNKSNANCQMLSEEL